MPQVSQSCFQHRSDWQCLLALECRQNDKKYTIGSPKLLRLTFRPRMMAGEDWVKDRSRSSRATRTKWRKLNVPTMGEKSRNTLEGDVLGCFRWQRSSVESTTIYSGMEDCDMVETQKCFVNESCPRERHKTEGQIGVTQHDS